MLPGADGFTVCKKVREFYNNPILMVTALGSDEEHIQGLEAAQMVTSSSPFATHLQARHKTC